MLRARLAGAIRTKAARGELRRGLPAGLIWGEAHGEILRHPDEQVVSVIEAVFTQFAVAGSARQVWLWLKDQHLTWPLQQIGCRRGSLPEITWVEPAYHAVHTTLTHPAYAGAYVYGRSRQEQYLGRDGTLKKRRRVLSQDQWEVLIPGHHEGFTDWDTYQANQARLAGNIRPQARQPDTGAVREGCALCQGLATCGNCGRKLAVYYDGPAKSAPGYYCTSGDTVNGRGVRHLRAGGTAIDAAVADAFLAALQPAALDACLLAARQLEAGHDTVLDQHRRQVEQARYQASRAERLYRAVDPENRLVARGLEAEWNTALQALADAENELARRQQHRPKALTAAEHTAILALGDDLHQVWDAPTTTGKDRKQLLRTLLDEVKITVCRDHAGGRADLLLHWKGGAITELTVPLKRKPPKIRTDEDAVALVRRLAIHYPDAKIAGILNRQGRTTPREMSYTAGRADRRTASTRRVCHHDRPPGRLRVNGNGCPRRHRQRREPLPRTRRRRDMDHRSTNQGKSVGLHQNDHPGRRRRAPVPGDPALQSVGIVAVEWSGAHGPACSARPWSGPGLGQHLNGGGSVAARNGPACWFRSASSRRSGRRPR